MTMILVSFFLFGWLLKFNTPELARLQGPKFFLITLILTVYIFFRLADRFSQKLKQITNKGLETIKGALFRKNAAPLKPPTKTLIGRRQRPDKSLLKVLKNSTIYQQGAAALLLLFLLHPNLVSNISDFNRQSAYYYAYDYADNILNAGQKENAIYLADDSFGFPAMYQLAVLNKTPGKKLVPLGNTFTNWGVENLFHNYPELRPGYLKSKAPPYSEYQLGPKLIRELIREKEAAFSVFSPFAATDLPPGFRNYQRILGYRISLTPPGPKTRSSLLRLRGFRQNSFVADQWSKALIPVYRNGY